MEILHTTLYRSSNGSSGYGVVLGGSVVVLGGSRSFWDGSRSDLGKLNHIWPFVHHCPACMKQTITKNM